MRPLAARRKLRALAEAGDDTTINNAAVELSLTSGRRTGRGLEKLLASHELPRVRAMAAWALGFQSVGAKAVDLLLRTLENDREESEVRGHAAEALGHKASDLGGREADVLAVLLRSLTDTTPEIRFWAAFALGNLGDERAIPALQRLADHDSESVPGWWSIRKEALDSIEQIGLIRGNRDDATPVAET